MISAESLKASDYYERDAAMFAERYDSIAFEDVHRPTIENLPKPSGTILDIGAGTGRDACALASMGYQVVGVEPTASFLAIAKKKCPNVRWIDDCLPELQTLHTQQRTFDLILCSAILMLIHPDQIDRSFVRMVELLRLGGKLVASVRNPIKGEPRKIFHRYSDEAVLSSATRAGLQLLEISQVDDALGRTGHQWRSFVFVKT